MGEVCSRKFFSALRLSVARALSEPSYLLVNCSSPVYGCGTAGQAGALPSRWPTAA